MICPQPFPPSWRVKFQEGFLGLGGPESPCYPFYVMPDTAPKSRTNMRRGRPFAKGEGGRRPGSRNRASLAVESLLAGEGEQLTRRAVDVAFTGDVAALRLCLERLCPPRRDRAVTLALP